MKEIDWENDPVEEISAEDIQAECKRAFFYAYNECNGEIGIAQMKDIKMFRRICECF